MSTWVISGSRGIDNYLLVGKLLDDIVITEGLPTKLIHGGARGVDQASGYWAKRKGIPVEVVRPRWDTEGRGAGYNRNLRMLEMADRVIAIWDGSSPGTAHMVKAARKAGKHLTVFTVGLFLA